MKNQLKFAVGLVLLLFCLDVWTGRAAVGAGPSGGGSTTVYNVLSTNNNTFLTNLIQSLDLWTNDVPFDNGERSIRPVDQTRTVEASITGTNSYALAFYFAPTNIPSGYSVGGYLFNEATNSAIGVLTWQLGKYGFVGESADNNSVLSTGDSVGVLGVSDGSFNLQYGTIGLGWSKKDGQSSVGIAGMATSDGHATPVRTAGYFHNFLDTPIGNHFTPLLGNVVTINDSGATGDDLAWWMTNSTSVLVSINAAGDPVILNNAGAGYLFTCMDGTGLGKWRPGNVISTNQSNLAVTNIILSLATNAINQNARIGPGTNNYLAKFNVGGTNVQNTSVTEIFSNYIQFGVPPASTVYTNFGYTNEFRTEVTDANNWESFFFEMGQGANSYLGLVGRQGSGRTQGIKPMNLHDNMIIEPGASPISGHTAGNVYPKVNNTGLFGTTSSHYSGFNSGTAGYVVVGQVASMATVNLGAGAGWGVSDTDINFIKGGTALMKFSGGSAGDQGFNLGTLPLMGGGAINVNNSFLMFQPNGVTQLGTNNINGAGTPQTNRLQGSLATGTDKAGGRLVIAGGQSTGTGANGALDLATAEAATSTGSTANTHKTRERIAPDPVTLTTNAATLVFNFTVPTALNVVGARVFATTRITDGTDVAGKTDDFTITAIRKGSTVTCTNSAPTGSFMPSGSAGIANTWTVVANAQSVDVKLTCVTSGILSTNSTVRYRVEIDSDGIPIITP